MNGFHDAVQPRVDFLARPREAGAVLIGIDEHPHRVEVAGHVRSLGDGRDAVADEIRRVLA
jgi:hypothetical protein